MRVALLAVVAGCTLTHTSPQPEPEPDPPPPPMGTALFTPILCTSGAIGDVSGCGIGGACCPFNNVDFSGAPFNVAGGGLRFVAQALTDTDLYLNGIELE